MHQPQPPIRLLLVDDESNVRRGLRMQLELEPDIEVVGEAGDPATALTLISSLHPDLVLMDVQMPGGDGIDATASMRRMEDPPHVVILTLFDDAKTRARAAAAGAGGFVGKHEPAERLLSTIRSLAAAG